MSRACIKKDIHTNTHMCTHVGIPHTRTFSLLFVAMVPEDMSINTQADTTSSYFLQAKIGVLD